MDVAILFRRRVRKLILSKYRSLDRLYLETDFSKGHISEILRGKGSPSVKTLIRLAKVLDVEVCDFFVFPKEANATERLSFCAAPSLKWFGRCSANSPANNGSHRLLGGRAVVMIATAIEHLESARGQLRCSSIPV